MDAEERKNLINQIRRRELQVYTRQKSIEEPLEARSERSRVMLERMRDVNTMRRTWSWVLLTLIGLTIVTDVLFIFLLGWGCIKFSSVEIVLAFLGQNLLKITGLAYIVVNFLFDKNKD